jgi:hypothetical protein
LDIGSKRIGRVEQAVSALAVAVAVGRYEAAVDLVDVAVVEQGARRSEGR